MVPAVDSKSFVSAGTQWSWSKLLHQGLMGSQHRSTVLIKSSTSPLHIQNGKKNPVMSGCDDSRWKDMCQKITMVSRCIQPGTPSRPQTFLCTSACSQPNKGRMCSVAVWNMKYQSGATIITSLSKYFTDKNSTGTVDQSLKECMMSPPTFHTRVLNQPGALVKKEANYCCSGQTLEMILWMMWHPVRCVLAQSTICVVNDSLLITHQTLAHYL